MQRILYVLVMLMIIFTSMLSCSMANETSKDKKEKAKTSQQKQTPMKKSPVEKYDLNPFDLSRTTLPTDYMGHDLKSVYEALEKRNEQTKKDEYETKEQYSQRIKNIDIDHKELIGKLTMNDIFSLVVIPKSRYDADSQTFTLMVDTTAVRGRDEGDRLRVGIEGFVGGKTRTYMGSNAYGASTAVKELNVDMFFLAISNISALPNRYKDNDDMTAAIKLEYTLDRILRGLPTYDEDEKIPIIKLDMKHITPKTAKNIRENLSIAFIYKLEEPYISVGIYRHEPTRDEPHDDSIFYDNVLASVKEIWVFNKTTGEILMKVKTRM